MKKTASAKCLAARFSKKSNARQYPFLQTDMGPYGKPTMKIYFTPYQNKSFTLPMKNKASKADWDSKKKRFNDSKFLTENTAMDQAERLYTENRHRLTSVQDVQKMADKMRKLAASVLSKADGQEAARDAKIRTHRRRAFQGLCVSRRDNGSITVIITKLGTTRCVTVGTVENSSSWNDIQKRVIGNDPNRINDIMFGVEKLYAKHYSNVASVAELEALKSKIYLMSRRIANEARFGGTEGQPAAAIASDVKAAAPADGCNPTAKVEVITPEAAAEMLRNGVRNRTLSRRKIAQYADDMRNGRWRVTGKCIDINTNGQLQEGFHRLTAVVEAGVPVKMMVARGVAPEAVTVYDCGILRNATHVMQVTESKNPSVVASIVKLHNILRNNHRVLSKDTKRKVLSNQQVHDAYMADQKGYEDAAVVGAKYSKQFGVFTKSWAGAIYYYLTADCRYPRKAVIDFYDSLFTMDTGKIQQADQLRRTMTDLIAKKYKVSDEARWTFFARAWNAYAAGTPVKRLKMLADGEEVPTVSARE